MHTDLGSVSKRVFLTELGEIPRIPNHFITIHINASCIFLFLLITILKIRKMYPPL